MIPLLALGGALLLMNPPKRRKRRRNSTSPRFEFIPYKEAHRWEAEASRRGVSTVARSPRGFMRAYQRAGSWRGLDPWWVTRRNNFIKRHMAQVRTNQEGLWKNGAPSRRCLALIMWAYMPPRQNPLPAFLRRFMGPSSGALIVAAANGLRQKYGGQALGWARDYVSTSKSSTKRAFWEKVAAHLRNQLVAGVNPRRKQRLKQRTRGRRR